MSKKSLPLLFLNLGGEMIYIIDQRLHAQEIQTEKSVKVLNDIIGTMLNPDLLEEFFKPQELSSMTVIRSLFENIAHASIMRLNEVSMNKLFDLMAMVVKYQVYRCLTPFDLILATINHLSAISNYATDPQVKKLVENAHAMILAHYENISPSELQVLRYTLLNFFQDFRIRVSVLLKHRVQNPNGLFIVPTNGEIPTGTEMPGGIQYFDAEGEKVSCITFHPGGNYTNISDINSSLELHTDFRGTTLGCNVYTTQISHVFEEPNTNSCESDNDMEKLPSSNTSSEVNSSQIAKKELDHLAFLIRGKRDDSIPKFHLNLFSPTEENEDQETNVETDQDKDADLPSHPVLHIDAKEHSRGLDLDKLLCGISLEKENCDENLLDLLDSAY